MLYCQEYQKLTLDGCSMFRISLIKWFWERRKVTAAQNVYMNYTGCLYRSRIEYKVSVLVYKCLNSMAPEYLSNLLTLLPNCGYCLRTNNNKTKLLVPFTNRKTFAARSFSVYGPSKWNDLPSWIRNIESLDCFKQSLKTYLFKRSFQS